MSSFLTSMAFDIPSIFLVRNIIRCFLRLVQRAFTYNVKIQKDVGKCIQLQLIEFTIKQFLDAFYELKSIFLITMNNKILDVWTLWSLCIKKCLLDSCEQLNPSNIRNFLTPHNHKFSQDLHYLDKKPLTWGCLYTLWEVLIARI